MLPFHIKTKLKGLSPVQYRTKSFH
ncbi:IS3 family transposase [Streptococcus moroccensis]